MLILIADAFDKSLPGRLAALGEVSDDMSRLPEAEVLLVRSKTKATKEMLETAPKVKLIIRGGVGMDNIDAAYCKANGIIATNTPEASSVAVAEVAMALMLAAPNQLILAHNALSEGKWLKKELNRTELYQKTLGLLGMGRIASEVAKRAKAFDMRVVAYDPYVKQSEYAEMMSQDEVLAQADYLSLHMPLTDETRGMINEANLAKMKKGVFIINTGRGKCVDEAALTKALEEGKVATYATDVWTSDPPPAECPLLKAPNVIRLPHIGASSKENLLRIGDLVVQKIQDYCNKK